MFIKSYVKALAVAALIAASLPGQAQIIFNNTSQNIYGNPTGTYGGLGLGSLAQGFGQNSTALGYAVETDANANRAMVIGSGFGPTSPLQNTLPHSLMVGFNSDLPTIFVQGGNGVGTLGKVGFGTTDPSALVTIDAGTGSNPSGYGLILERNQPASGYEQTQVAMGISSNNGPAGFRLQTSADDGGNWIDGLFVANDGKVGVGSTTPLNNLHVNNSAGIERNESSTGGPNFAFYKSKGSVTNKQDVALGDVLGSITFHGYRGGYSGIIAPAEAAIYAEVSKTPANGHVPTSLHFRTQGPLGAPSNSQMIINSGGQVGIGTENFVGNHLLYVGGKIICEELTVKLEADWADYVFEEDYQRLTLNELEGFILKNKHLPGIPSAQEIAETGVGVGDMQRAQMEKIEELTLYILELHERIETLEANQNPTK